MFLQESNPEPAQMLHWCCSACDQYTRRINTRRTTEPPGGRVTVRPSRRDRTAWRSPSNHQESVQAQNGKKMRLVSKHKSQSDHEAVFIIWSDLKKIKKAERSRLKEQLFVARYKSKEELNASEWRLRAEWLGWNLRQKLQLRWCKTKDHRTPAKI